jgi:glycosyltransferase involved in cell wall biosynthesis
MTRILLVTSTLPWPLRRNGGGQRTALLRRALQRWGDVDVLGVGGAQLRDHDVTDDMLETNGVSGCFIRTSAPPKEPAPWWALGPLGGVHDLLETWRGRFRPEPGAVQWIQERMSDPRRRYDLIVGRYLAAAMMGGVATPVAAGVPKLLDFDDMEWQTLEAQIQHDPWPGVKGRIGAAMVLHEVERICFRSLKLFRHVWVTSAEDAALLPSDAPAHSVLPNIPFLDPLPDLAPEPPPAGDDATDVLFVGDLQLPANRDGLDEFITHAWPAVLRQCPNAVLRIVGRGLSAERRARWSLVPGVVVVGFAPDLAACYADAAVCVVPAFYGGGTKIKVLEALLMNRPVVTTEHALRGYSTLNVHGQAVWVASDCAALAEGCVRMLRDVPLRREMAARGRGVVLRDFSWDRFQAVVDSAVKPLLRPSEEDPLVGLTVTLPVYPPRPPPGARRPGLNRDGSYLFPARGPRGPLRCASRSC